MRTRQAISALAMMGALMAPAIGAAQTIITFDDSLPNLILSPYHGLNWRNFYIGNTTTLPSPTGYQNAAVSAPNIAYNGGGLLASILSYNPAAVPPPPLPTFTFNSAYFTAAWRDALTLTVNGYNGTTQIFQRMVTLNTTGPLFVTFNWADVTKVDFISSGGTARYSSDPTATEFAMDNLTINGPTTTVPEPSAISLLATGLAGLLPVARRRLLV